jgi:hypothetical protein
MRIPQDCKEIVKTPVNLGAARPFARASQGQRPTKLATATNRSGTMVFLKHCSTEDEDRC